MKKRTVCRCGKPRSHHSRIRVGYIEHKFVKRVPRTKKEQE